MEAEMKADLVLGKINPELVTQFEQEMSRLFIEFGAKYDTFIGSKLGGDPFIFALINPIKHVITNLIPTAATDGIRYYWNPAFMLSKTPAGRRFIVTHEATHSFYMHPARTGGRNPKLWNICVDYIVHKFAAQDLESRKDTAPILGSTNGLADYVKQNLGDYITLPECEARFKDPFAFWNLDDIASAMAAPKKKQYDLSDEKANKDRELTAEEEIENARQQGLGAKFYFDFDLPENLGRPEALYDHLVQFLPKCPECGRLGVYKMSDKMKKDLDKKVKEKKKEQKKEEQKRKEEKEKQKQAAKDSGEEEQGEQGEQGEEEQGEGDSGDQGDQDCCGNSPSNKNGSSSGSQGGGCCDNDCDCGCPSCGDGMDIFDLTGPMDEHMDSKEGEKEAGKRLADAIDFSQKIAGSAPAGYMAELGRLSRPKVSWQDYLKSKVRRIRDGNIKTSYVKYKTRPMFAGLLVPKKVSYQVKLGICLDTSGSMADKDIAYGISQLQSIGEMADGFITPADGKVYWDDTIKVNKFNTDTVSKTKVVGRGGTQFVIEYLKGYKSNLHSELDVIVFITDGCLFESNDEIAKLKPRAEVLWLVTSHNNEFHPPYGKVLHLMNEQL